MSLDLFHPENLETPAFLVQDDLLARYSYGGGAVATVAQEIYAVSVLTTESGEFPSITEAEEGISAGRIIEVLLSSIVLVALSPVMLVVALALHLAGNVSIIYSQERVGLNGKTFKIYKFRTMHADAEQSGPRITTTHDDHRITMLGRVLRKTKLDELPQLWNVLKGDMSLIGPRPERPFFHNKYLRSIDQWERRVSVKPGITGLAQITVSHDPTEKIIYDLIYIENKCWALNVKILFTTVLSLFRKEEPPISSPSLSAM